MRRMCIAGASVLAVGSSFHIAFAQPLGVDLRPVADARLEHLQLQASSHVDGVLTLDLQRHSVVSPRTTIVIVGATESVRTLDASRYAVYRGHVAGYPDSHVVFSVTPTRIRGRIELGVADRRFDVVQANTEALDHEPLPIWLTPTSHFGGVPQECVLTHARESHRVSASTKTSPTDRPVNPSAAAAENATGTLPWRMGEPKLGLKQIEMAIDSDYECYQLFLDEQRTLDYLIEVYGLVSDLTERDLNSRLDITWMRVFTTPTDPYGNNIGWFPQIPGGVKYDNAQLFSGARGSQAGGGALICGAGSWIENALGSYGDPLEAHIYNQDLIIPAHELGHCLGSPHTHELGLDQCATPGTIPRRGGIISYCYYFNGGYANTDMRYETACQTAIAQCMASAPKYVFDCNQNGVDDKVDILVSTSKDVNANGVPDECEDCNGNGILDSIDIASGLSKDLDANKVPDECQPDCNGNLIPDALDIKNGTSKDLYQNGIPDECETDCNGNGFSDYNEIQLDMSLDLDRNVILDECQDCDRDGVNDIIAINGANACWAVESEDEVIREYHPMSGSLMRQSASGHLSDPRDLLITPTARILVGSAGDHRIVEFNREGDYVRDLVPPGAGGLNIPTGMLLDGSTLLVASEGTESVKAFHIDTGAFIGDRVMPGSGGLVDPHGLERTPAGTLLVTSSQNEVLEYDLDSGKFIRVLVKKTANGGLDTPRGILALPDQGKLLVAGLENNNLYAYNLETGAPLGIWHNGSFGGKLSGPYGLRRGWDGVIYTSCSTHPEFHLTDPKILTYREDTGWLIRGYVQRDDAMLEHPRGFDFMPAAGFDCNANQLPDSCDIASGFSQDANNNGIPDECEKPCIADCDGSGRLNIDDFVCFQTRYAIGDPLADCDGSGSFNIDDFVCFQTAYAIGC